MRSSPLSRRCDRRLRDAARGQARLSLRPRLAGRRSFRVVGRLMVVDAVAGAAPQTVTLIDVNSAVLWNCRISRTADRSVAGRAAETLTAALGSGRRSLQRTSSLEANRSGRLRTRTRRAAAQQAAWSSSSTTERKKPREPDRRCPQRTQSQPARQARSRTFTAARRWPTSRRTAAASAASSG